MRSPDACQDRHQPREKSPAAGLRRVCGMDGAGGDCNAPTGPQSFTFRVEGMAPAPQGSKRHVGGGRMVESCREVKPWRLLVAQAALSKHEPTCKKWSDWQWAAWSELRNHPFLASHELLKKIGPRRHGITLLSLEIFLPVLANCMARQEARLLRGPVRTSMVFVFPRPAGHFRRDGSLKSSAPAHHAVKPDGDKLLRSTGDALSGVVIEDDARIVGGSWEKRYCIGAERPGAIVTLIRLR